MAIHLQLGTANFLSKDEVFTGHDTPLFNHLAVHKFKGTVFIGAVNYIYVLSSDLQLLGKISTGPVAGLNNYNKLLLIHCDGFEWLITCDKSTAHTYTIYYLDMMEIHPTPKFWDTGKTSTGGIIQENEDAPAMTFLCKGNKRIYLGASYNDYFIPELNMALGNMGQKWLNKSDIVPKSDYNSNSEIFNTKYQNKYKVNYIYGFNLRNYNYFLTTQQKFTGSKSVFVSKLIRICDETEKCVQKGYAEITIECKTYNLAQAASVGKPGTLLVKSMKIKNDDDVLFGLFSRSKNKDPTSNEPSNHSALCIYSLNNINNKLDSYTKNYFNRNSVIPQKLNQSCIEKNKTVGFNFCISTWNMPLDDNMHETTYPIFTRDTLFTAISTKLDIDYNDVFIGTHTGHLMKIILGNASSVLEYEDLTIDEGSPVNSDLLFSPEKDYLYIMTKNNVNRIEVIHNVLYCSQFKNFSSCIHTTLHSYCGWCLFENKCTRKINCSYSYNDYSTSTWLSYNYQKEVGTISNGANSFPLGDVDKLQISIENFIVTVETTCTFTIDGENEEKTRGFILRDIDNIPKVICLIPLTPMYKIQQKFSNKNYLNVTLSIININSDGSDIAIWNIAFFDCDTYASCETCTSSIFACQWHANKKKCYYIGKKNATGASQIHYLNCGNTTMPVQENSYFTTTSIIYGSVVFITVLALYVIKKTITKYSHSIRELQQQVNVMGRETIAMKQCVKRVIIHHQISLDENLSDILKLPNVAIQHTSIQRAVTGTSAKSEFLLPTDDRWEYPRSDLTLGKCIGEGEFGKVLQGEAKNILRENITTVAVKMLKDEHSDEDMINLVSEMEIMKLIKPHTNVLELLGCCTKDGVLLVITEYALHGNLQEFLRKHHPSDGEITSTKLSLRTLIKFAVQVANGMQHLASIKCIHRDLAARNVLVSENYILKIADFGLAKDISKNDYYRKTSNGRLPVKWMAPESLSRNVYSTQSDVWSYGILLWEIFTLGSSPYPSLPDLEKLYPILCSGYRMEKPPNCPDDMYSLMQKCWSILPQTRPSFSMIVGDLGEILPNDETLEHGTENLPMEQDADEESKLLVNHCTSQAHVHDIFT